MFVMTLARFNLRLAFGRIGIVAAAFLYLVSYAALRQGYISNPTNSEAGPLPMDPTVTPLSLIGLFGVYLVRNAPIVQWIWIVCLAFWTYANLHIYWIGLFFIDGHHGCVLCDDHVLLLLVATPIWALTAVVTWIVGKRQPAD
jgi:hypothetical protein